MGVSRKEKTLERLIAGRKGREQGREVLLATVSGVGSTKPGLIKYFDRKIHAVGLITTKSYQVLPNPGNREPIITEPGTGCFGNSVGLRNPGMEQAAMDLALLRETGIESILNVSVSASTPGDFITLVRTLGPFADILELNFSCPHAAAGYGASIGCDPGIAAQYMQEVREAVGNDFPALIFPKLTPNVDNIGIIARAVLEAGADGISAINTTGPEMYVEPDSDSPILNNALGGKGGRSGSWVHERALECLRQIRESVGADIPVIGMGGVSTGRQAAAMVLAGADAVGIGSALGMVHQRDWPEYLSSVAGEAGKILAGEETDAPEEVFLRSSRAMDFTPHKITGIIRHTDDISIITLDGSLACGPGEYAFLWLPGIGEKPFSIAESNPLTFIVKARGHFTAELLKRKAGDTVYVRGVYGAEVDLPKCSRAVLAAGGTGIAVLPSLAKKLKAAGIPMSIYYGTTADAETRPLLQDELGVFGSFTAIPDDGVPGRILSVMAKMEGDLRDAACFFVGPEPFMARAAEIAEAGGASGEAILLSMERPSMCGIGMCGECACGDRLTCQYGTFLSYSYLEKHAPELLV